MVLGNLKKNLPMIIADEHCVNFNKICDFLCTRRFALFLWGFCLIFLLSFCAFSYSKKHEIIKEDRLHATRL